MHPARLFIVCGLPGAGKTRRTDQLTRRFAATRMSPDEWMARLDVDIWDGEVRTRIERIQADLTIDLLRVGASVVVESGTWRRSERDGLRERAVDVGALVHLVFLDAPVDVLWERVRARDRERRVGSRSISRDDLVEWSAVIERPTDDESAAYDPIPPERAGRRPGSVSYPYGSWLPQSRPR